jgi:hypothetical protein
MTGPNSTETTETIAPATRRACLVEGCTCKDARILSLRRASYFASIARSRGETAGRVIAADDDWLLPTSPALDAVRALAADTTLIDLPVSLDVELDAAA